MNFASLLQRNGTIFALFHRMFDHFLKFGPDGYDAAIRIPAQLTEDFACSSSTFKNRINLHYLEIVILLVLMCEKRNEIKYKSTRGGESGITFEQCLFSAYASDNGLYVPEEVPIIPLETILSWKNYTFSMVSAEIIHMYTNIDIQVLRNMTLEAYSKFNDGNITLPMTSIESGVAGDVILLDASQGPTLAFKDVGLQVVVKLYSYYLSKNNKKAKVVVDTSGDTGPAAIAAVKGCQNLDITVLYPDKRVSPYQELQMITELVDNVQVYRTEGDTDEQAFVLKEIFGDAEFKEKHNLCSINSINWARIMAQSAYYIWAYLQIYNTEADIGKLVDFCVPTGAFGNSMGAYLAKMMNLPIGRIYCATNANDAVHQLISKGSISNKASILTLSPAMDIQFAYNVERMLYFVSSRDTDYVSNLMHETEKLFNESGPEVHSIDIADSISLAIQEVFSSYSVSDAQINATIRDISLKHQFALCPHSACAVFVATQVIAPPTTNDTLDVPRDKQPVICILTANVLKFEDTFWNALRVHGNEELKQKLRKTFIIPKSSASLEQLSLLPQSYQWLHKTDNWKEEWISILKASLAQV